MTDVKNLFAGIPATLPEELFEDLLVSDRFRIERIISRGHRSPDDFWYDQKENEWVLLVAGSAALAFDGRESPVVLAPGDHFNIPAGVKHRVEWTDPEETTVWLAVYY